MPSDTPPSTTPQQPVEPDKVKELFDIYGSDTVVAVHKAICDLGDLYQHRWPKIHFSDSEDAYIGEIAFWCKVLKDIKPKFIEMAVESILKDETSFSSWPPNAVEFLGLCKEAIVEEQREEWVAES